MPAGETIATLSPFFKGSGMITLSISVDLYDKAGVTETPGN